MANRSVCEIGFPYHENILAKEVSEFKNTPTSLHPLRGSAHHRLSPSEPTALTTGCQSN